MKNIVFFLCALLISFQCYSQEIKVKVYDPPIQYSGNLSYWGTNLIVSNTEPLGKASGIVRPTDTLYVAIPDTNIVSGSCIAILRSTNNGYNWVLTESVTPATIVSKNKNGQERIRFYLLPVHFWSRSI